MDQEVNRKCPKCGSDNIEVLSARKTFDETVYLFKCRDCEVTFS